LEPIGREFYLRGFRVIRLTRWLFVVPLFLSIVLLGCSKKAGQVPTGTVSGKVTYKNAPVTGGAMAFHGKDAAGKDALSRAVLKGDGTYTAIGVPLGDVVVTIETDLLDPAGKTTKEGKDAKQFKAIKSEEFIKGKLKIATTVPADPEQKYVKIPEKYKSEKTSPLSLKIAEGSQTKDLDLQD
jgi:protein-disulfide isomerase